MTATTTAPPERRTTPSRFRVAAPTWSRPAALRGLRAAVVVPVVLALTFKVIGDPQMATYAAFGSFANLVLAPFTGSRRDKLIAHVGLGLAGTALLSIGTSVNATTAVAAVVTLVVTFVVLLAGVTGPKAAAGGLAAMLAYVLAAASPGTVSMIPARIEGWWLATAAATIAVLVMTPSRTHDQLRAAAAASAGALALEVASTVDGVAVPAQRIASVEAEERLRALFNASPYRPTGLATVAQAVGNMIELLGWVTALVGDTVADLDQLGELATTDRALLASAGEVLGAVARLLGGEDVLPDLDRLEQLRLESAGALRHLDADDGAFEAAVHASFHARTVAVAVRGVASDALITAHRADPETIAEQRMQWLPGAAPGVGRFSAALHATGPHPSYAVATAAAIFARHASLRSIWIRNSARGAVAVAAAVTVADLTNVQHGFWVVLGTLTVLRTTATGTGGTAMRTLLGTAAGFLIGGAIVLAVGTDTTVLWVVLPVAVLVAAYAPGALPVAAGQAAFTAMLVVLYNLLIPVGWRVGAIRVEDIAVGCGISLLVGALFWPRGATEVVAVDLHDAFLAASDYLVEASEWALGLRTEAPDAAARLALIAGLRLEDALRAFLTEQGTKAIAKADLWTLVGAVQRVRLTAAAVAELPPPASSGPGGEAIRARARVLAAWYVTVATHIARGEPALLTPLDPPTAAGDEAPADQAPAGPRVVRPHSHLRACQTCLSQHLQHLRIHHDDVILPAGHLRQATRLPWWRPPPSARQSAEP